MQPHLDRLYRLAWRLTGGKAEALLAELAKGANADRPATAEAANLPLVMTCENDTGSTPAMSRGIGDEIDGAEVIIVPRLQHLGLLEEPRLFLDPILGFFGRIYEKD